jgi:hypothetical protein
MSAPGDVRRDLWTRDYSTPKAEEAKEFESFELLRPNEGRDDCLVLTR